MSEDGYYDEREHRCELLVRIIQSREGSPSKEEREEAFAELLEMFRPLIRSIASRVYKCYRTGLRTDFPSFYHDTITTVIEMVLADYIPKKSGGKAMFAPYLQTKLYYRTLYRAQKTAKLYKREVASPVNFETGDQYGGVLSNFTVVSRDSYAMSFNGQIEAAILAQITGKNETTFDIFQRHEVASRLQQLNLLAKRKLTEREHFIWSGTLYSGLNMNEIASTLNENLEPEENPWTKQRVYNMYHKIRIKVLSAYGEASLAGEV